MATIKANPSFNVENACKELNHAMKGFGTNEKKLIEVLTSHNNAQRQEIRNKYKIMYGKDLKDHIKSETEGKFQEGLVGLLLTPAEYDARTLNKGLNLIATRPSGLIEILATRNDAQLREIEKVYKAKYNSDLDADIKRDVHFQLEEVLRALATATRPEDNKIDANQAVEDAKALFEAGEAHFGTHESEFIRVLCSRSYAQLRKTFDEYAKLAGKDIRESIKTETTGFFEDALLAIVECVRDIPKYFAEQLHDDMARIGTDDDGLVRKVITRSEIDLEIIKKKYQELYNESLHDRIVHETHAHYEELLKAICKK